MKCPSCQSSDTRVIDSRVTAEGFSIRRRRECLACEYRFTTYEQIAETPIIVVKKDGSRVPFDRRKLRSGLEKACYKRPVSPEKVDDIISKLEAALIRQGETEISSARIGELVMEPLRQLDQVAYVRFASVYRDFKDVSDFAAEIRPLLGNDASPAAKKS